MFQSIKSRIAPTPSGYLHVGNAYNFLVTYREAVIKRGGELILRIDDSDKDRSKDEYIEDIFESLEWLGIKVNDGPKNLKDFKQNFSQGLKHKEYLEFLKRIPDLYNCSCSRSFLKENSCPCAQSKKPFEKGKTAIKMDSPHGSFILWRKEDLPSYHLTSLYDDIEMNINFIVRGEDLVQTSKEQFFMAERIKDKIFTKAVFLHHPLIQDQEGKKISKSAGTGIPSSESLISFRRQGKTTHDLLKRLGFESMEDFLLK
ncbi:MAG: glutamyl-tRNA synthetase [Bacteriovoracaceae bacterium]|jgi:glutamyl-tRNA synthetase